MTCTGQACSLPVNYIHKLSKLVIQFSQWSRTVWASVSGICNVLRTKKGSTIHEETSGVSPERMEFGSKIRFCQEIWHNTTMNKKYEKQAERKEGQSWSGKL